MPVAERGLAIDVAQSIFHEFLLSFGICMQVRCFYIITLIVYLPIILVNEDSCDGWVACDIGDKLRVVDQLAFSGDGIIERHGCVEGCIKFLIE